MCAEMMCDFQVEVVKNPCYIFQSLFVFPGYLSNLVELRISHPYPQMTQVALMRNKH